VDPAIRTRPPAARITRALILINVAVFALQAIAGRSVLATFALWPLGRFVVRGLGVVGFQPWQLVTSAFLHAGVAHLVLNMFALQIFGRDVERTLGSRRYLVLYFAAVLSGACVQLLVVSASADVRPFPTIGASGGVFGVLLAFGMLFPRRIVVLLFPPIPLPARTFVALYALIELASGVFQTQAGVAHFAHLGGMLGAWLVLRRWRHRPGGTLVETATPPWTPPRSPEEPHRREW
jgi:membrane associated rhomboid family serine protease